MPEDGNAASAEDLQSWIRRFKSSGDALVVVSNETARETMLYASREPDCSWTTFTYEGRAYPLKLHRVHNEPMGIIWENFAKRIPSTREFYCRLAWGMCELLFAILVYTALLFVYVMYYRQLIKVPGVSPDFFQDVLIGLLSALGSVFVVEPTVNKICDQQGFRRKDRRDALRMILLSFGYWVSVMLDLYVAVVIAEQMLLDNAFQDKVEGPGNVLVESIASIVFPGYLLLCPFAGLLLVFIAPYILYSMVLRTRNIGRRECEKYLQPEPMDIVNRYAEMLANLTLVLSLGFAASNKYWQLLAMMFGYLVLIVIVERALLLHYAREVLYSTGRLSFVFAALWVVPTGGQALLVCWWAFKAGYVAWWSGCAALIMHVTIYLCVIFTMKHRSKYRRKSAVIKECSYSEMEEKLRSQGHVSNYFNTNPIFCLRSWLLPSSESGWDRIGGSHEKRRDIIGCVPYFPGKFYLQPGTPSRIEGADSKWIFS
eukprot:TRINITY_DN16991_c0_g1_i4.p1 TRINITY_DN16991_c0_g1~~TRINITY_DN16991_c0_g1_i4.p1  ORF type:complete len:485 (-),score=44.26 TRINITY_DN16991_c0_g1_i4:74-1528(-)